MSGKERIAIGVLSLVLMSGCRTTTRMLEEPRVDLEMPEGANRGFLIGTPPPLAEGRKTTRQMVETEIEVPPLMKTAPPADAGAPATEAPIHEGAAAPFMETYVVKAGDSLSKIAARPEVFGDGSKWPRLLKANRDVLKDPNQLRPGMVLKIPHGTSGGRSAESSEATTLTK